MLTVAVGLMGFFLGVVVYAWWVHPDFSDYRKKIAALEKQNEQFRQYILRSFKVKMYKRGVEIDIDDNV